MSIFSSASSEKRRRLKPICDQFLKSFNLTITQSSIHDLVTAFHIPRSPLCDFVESFFYYREFEPQHLIERLLPDGNVQVIFELTEHPKYIYDNDTLREIQSCRRVWFSGFRTEPISIPSGIGSEMLIINFRKGRAFPFICEPMHALKNTVVDGQQVLTNDILNLRDQIQEAGSTREMFGILEANLLRFFLRSLSENPFIDYAVSRISAAPHSACIRELSRKVGYSQKHLIRLFKDHIGVTPKDFLKVARFQKVVSSVHEKQDVEWTRVAHTCGYYDQSHLIADFKKLSGFTPRQYMGAKSEMLNYIPVL